MMHRLINALAATARTMSACSKVSPPLHIERRKVCNAAIGKSRVQHAGERCVQLTAEPVHRMVRHGRRCGVHNHTKVSLACSVGRVAPRGRGENRHLYSSGIGPGNRWVGRAGQEGFHARRSIPSIHRWPTDLPPLAHRRAGPLRASTIAANAAGRALRGVGSPFAHCSPLLTFIGMRGSTAPVGARTSL